jgi:hypothetical protein
MCKADNSALLPELTYKRFLLWLYLSFEEVSTVMKIMVFLHGTAIMHKNGLGVPREERVKQVIQGTDPSLQDYASYVPVGNAVTKIKAWQEQGAEICYLSSHTSLEDVNKDRLVLQTYGFPEGMVFSRAIGQSYQDVAETVLPDVLIEDDCESIGGEQEMTITHVRPEYKKHITSIIVKEFGGIDHLPDTLTELKTYTSFPQI